MVVAKLLPPPNKGAPIDCHVIDNSDGSYTCTYLPVKALQHVDIMVSVNGTRLADTPFKASFAAGKTEPSNCRAFGANLHHGIAGKPLSFHVLARDAYSNQRLSGGDAFHVHVSCASGSHPELALHLKKWSAEATITDLNNGTYGVSWSSNFAGWYSVAVSLDRVPVHGSPFRVCLLAAVARLPEALVLRPCLHSQRTPEDALPPPVSARSCALLDSVLAVRRPLLRREGERPPRHDWLHLLQTESKVWSAHEIKGPPLPEATELAGVDALLLLFAHGQAAASAAASAQAAAADAPIDAVWACDLDALRASGELRRQPVSCSGPFPLATSAAQLCTVRKGLGHAHVWFVGGKDGGGRLIDAFRFDSLAAEWSCAHCPARGVLAAGEAPARRENHSVVCAHDCLWVFGGRSDQGCLSDLCCLDLGSGEGEGEGGARPEWKKAQPNGSLPAARELHSAVVLEPTGLMLIVGGLDETGSLPEEVVALDLFALSWSRLAQGAVPRHSVACACVRGELLLFGGLDTKGHAHAAMLSLDLAAWQQASCLELSADSTEFVSVKGQAAAITSLRNSFSVEAWVLARSFPPYATIISKADGGWKTGFGLAKYGAGKGDAEEVPQVNFWLTPGYATTKVQAQIEPLVWTHVCGTYDGQHLRILLNGTVHDTLEFKAEKEEEIEALHYAKADFCIGAHPGKAGWDGLIDEVRLWSVPRTEAQVREAMHGPVPAHTPGLVGQWTFNEGAGELCVDSSGQRNHGTLEGGLARVLSTRTDRAGSGTPTASERRAESVIAAFSAWKATFEQTHGHPPSKADILLTGGKVTALARQLGHLD